MQAFSDQVMPQDFSGQNLRGLTNITNIKNLQIIKEFAQGQWLGGVVGGVFGGFWGYEKFSQS